MAIPHLLDDNHQMFCRVERIDVRVQIVKWNYAELVARSQRRESLAVRNSTPANTKTSVEQPCEINVSMRVLIGVPTSAGEASEGEVEVRRAGAVHAQKLAHGPDISHTRICLNIF